MTLPKLTQSDAQVLLNKYLLTENVVLLGIRGYFKKTMGNPVSNDRGIYDDALFVMSPDIFAAFNANTDPSVARIGIATLKPGVWWYRQGKHKISSPKGYLAFVQAAEVTVARDGQEDETGFFGINIHRGGYNTTSSLGCQTIYPTQWESFRSTVYDQMNRYNQTKIPYVLIEG